MFWKKQIASLTQQIAESQQRVNKYSQESVSLFNHGKLNGDKLSGYFGEFLENNNKDVQSYLQKQMLAVVGNWQNSQWQNWSVLQGSHLSTLTHVELIRIGELIERRQDANSLFSVPEFVPFIGGNKIVIIRCNDNNRDLGLELLQSLVVRTAILLPYQIRYTFCDPVNNGGAFLMRRSLPEGLVRENSGEVYRDLVEVTQDIRRVKETYLDPQSPALHLLPPDIRVNERFEGIFVADFPKRYDRRDIEELQKIGSSGPDAGRYVFIHYNQDIPLPRDISLDGFENALYIDLDKQGNTRTSHQFQFQPDSVPEAKLQKNLLDKVKQAKPPERKLGWNETIGIPEQKWWTESSDELIRTPIGGRGSSDTLDIWFGKDREGHQCAHGMLGAMTGQGKSTLFHIFILGLATRYSPSELRLYLIDGKYGVELAPYRNLPHAEVVSLHSSPELSRSVLTELITEKERRNALFKRLGVSELSGYRRLGQPEGKMPRILLLVDEYQELFQGDKEDSASSQLLILAQQGRSAGIHMLLASQRFGAAGMRDQTGIFGNIHLRMGLKMSLSDIQSLTEFGKRGKELLKTCDLPGKIVVNDSSGDDNSNLVGKVAFIEKSHRDQLIQELAKKAHQLPPEDYAEAVVFDGDAQPNLSDNPQLRHLLDYEKWLTPSEWEVIARKPLYQGGLELADWFSAEHPTLLWLGQEFSVRKQARLILRRRPCENIVVMGGDFSTARYGMLAGMLTSLALNGNPQQLSFVIVDRSIPGTQWHSALEDVYESILRPVGFTATFNRESKNVGKILDNLITQLEERNQLSEAELIDQPSQFVFMTELDRVDELRRSNEGYSTQETPLGSKLKRLCVEGPTKGIHLILSFSGTKAMSNVLEIRKGLSYCRHRVVLQMSEDDSFTLVRDRQASRLQADGPIPIKALYLDTDSDRSTLFKPYSTEGDNNDAFPDLRQQLQAIGQHLAKWSY